MVTIFFKKSFCGTAEESPSVMSGAEVTSLQLHEVIQTQERYLTNEINRKIYSQRNRNIATPQRLFFFLFLRAAPTVYGSSQARGRIGAVAIRLHCSHRNVRSKLHL